MKKLRNIEAGLKKSIAHKKACSSQDFHKGFVKIVIDLKNS